MKPTINCNACRNKVNITERLKCCTCKSVYHYMCLNITTEDFRKNGHKYDTSWQCFDCLNLTSRRRTRNDDTPARSIYNNPNIPKVNPRNLDLPIISRSPSPGNCNVTVRNKTLNTINDSMYADNDDTISLPGDTLQPSSPQNRNILNTTILQDKMFNSLTVGQWENIIDGKLTLLKEQIITEIRDILLTEIKDTLSKHQVEFKQETNTEISECKVQESLNNKLENIEKEKDKLQKEILEIHTIIKNNNMQNKIEKNISTPVTEVPNQLDHKIVLYGLDEHPWEDEYQLHDRIIHIFQEITNINLSGYVEDVKRLGKRGTRRPIIIELLSKRLTRNIIHNSRFFKGTGLAVAECLDKISLENRREMIATLAIARKNGQRANIINNLLYINGKEYNPEMKKSFENITYNNNDIPSESRTTTITQTTHQTPNAHTKTALRDTRAKNNNNFRR